MISGFGTRADIKRLYSTTINNYRNRYTTCWC